MNIYPYHNSLCLGYIIMIHFKFVSNSVKYCIDDRSVIISDQVVFATDYAENTIACTWHCLLLMLLLIHQFTQIIYFLFRYGLCIHDIKAVKVDNLFLIIAHVYFVVYLPCYIIVDLLEHLFILIKSYLALCIWATIVVFSICLRQQLIAYFCILFYYHGILLK